MSDFLIKTRLEAQEENEAVAKPGSHTGFSGLLANQTWPSRVELQCVMLATEEHGRGLSVAFVHLGNESRRWRRPYVLSEISQLHDSMRFHLM